MSALRLTSFTLTSPRRGSSTCSSSNPRLSGTGSDNRVFRWGTDSHRLTTTSPLQSTQPLAVASSSMAASRSSSDRKLNSVQGPYTEIIVIRHGETEWNCNRKIQGHLDVDLNEVGRMQAAAVAEQLSGESKVSAVYSSDLKRALETAETIASRCGGLEVIQDLGLRERHLGDLQGLVFREAAKICPEAHQALLSHRTDTEIPGGGESFDQLYKRCTSALQRIGNKHKGERVVVVTHGGVIRALQKRASPHRRSPGKVLNTSINVFHLSDGNRWTIKTWGDVSHLDDTGFLKSGFGGDNHSG